MGLAWKLNPLPTKDGTVSGDLSQGLSRPRSLKDIVMTTLSFFEKKLSMGLR
jgi:hypothetical protein